MRRSTRSAISILAACALLTSAEAAEANWWNDVRQRIQAEEYEISWQKATRVPGVEGAWHAPNRAHDLRTYFTPDGIHVIRRTARESEWQLDLFLVGYGRGDSVGGVSVAAPSPAGNRIEYDRGEIVEWYVNDPRGLEQGFTLLSPPDDSRLDGSAAPTPAFLALALRGGLSPVLASDRQSVSFEVSGGTSVLRYSKLEVSDARGTQIPAWIEGFNQGGVRGLRLVFDDREAVYPVTVDPLLDNPSWTADGNQADAEFGWSVATAGDVDGDGFSDVIVGARLYDNGQPDEGRAFVYRGSASGLSSVASWSAEGDQAGAQFGIDVSTAGDVNGDGYGDVIVGAYLYDNGQVDEGGAFLYEGSASGLASSASWTTDSDQGGARFGVSVSTAGDVNGDGYGDVIVGAYLYDNGQPDEGRAFVYHGSASGLSPGPAWFAESDQTGANFGVAVSTAGDIDGDGYAEILVGAFLYDDTQLDEGRAYVYAGSASGLSAAPVWTADGEQGGARFAGSISTAGDVNGDGHADVIIGAYLYDEPFGGTDAGRAFAFYGRPGGLPTKADWSVAIGQPAAAFARSVSTAGDVNGDGYADVIVGAERFDGGEASEGGAFVYHGSAGGLSAGEDWSVESDQAGARLGIAVSTAGDVDGDGFSEVIVGAYLYTDGETGEGRAWVYHGSAAGLDATAGWTAESDLGGAGFGGSVAMAGDVNGDGYTDVIVGAGNFDDGQAGEGRAFVYHGSATGLATVAAWTADGDQHGAAFGYSVSTAGDVNGDGYADVIVGARTYDNGEVDEGRAFVYHGSAAGLAGAAAWTAEADQADALFGQSVAAAGDVDADGYADVIVGAWKYDNGEVDEGAAFVYHGSATGLAAAAAWSTEGDQPGAALGWSVAGAGDVDADGHADVIVGAHLYHNGEVDEGRAFVHHGSATGLSTVPDWVAESDQAGAHFGGSVGTAGDVDGDGYAEVIVGASRYDNGELNEGRAFVYHGSALGLATTPGWTAEADQADADFGGSVATAGDVNGDGYADVAVGSQAFDNGQTNEGRVFVYHGSAAGLAMLPAWTAESDQAFAIFGNSVATAGDVNGDGYAEVIAGASTYDNGETDEGRAFLYYGNDGRGVSLRPRQRRADDTAPIAHQGTSDAADAFGLAAIGRSPFGRGRVKLEWEVKPLGTPFDGTGTETSATWMDTGTAGVDIGELASGLAGGTPHHWRVRLHHDPVTTPLLPRSRWLTVPLGGWEETDLRTLAVPVAAGGVGTSLRIEKASGLNIQLNWSDSCLGTDTDYEIYEGNLGSFYDHEAIFCTTGGETSKVLTPRPGSAYYLVVPRNDDREGSYGVDGDGVERPTGNGQCLVQASAGC